MAVALGCIGMSLDDFCRCTPSEFYAVWDAWERMEQQRERQRWEQTRTQCLCALQPYSTHKLQPEDVMKFEWDHEAEQPKGEEAPHMTHEEEMARYREIKRQWGLK